MPTKAEYCFRVMRKYGVLVDFEGDVEKTNVPEPLENHRESLHQWTARVFGKNINEVVVYMPQSLNGRRLLANLQSDVGADHIKSVIDALAKVKKVQTRVKVKKATAKTERIFSTFPKETVQEHLNELGNALEPSVKEFFARQLNESAEDIDAETLLKELMISFNDVAREYRTRRIA
jgi:hypothetical protein